MNEKAAKSPVAAPAGVPARPARQRKGRGESPASRRLQQLQGTADASAGSGKLRQLQQAAYLRPHAGALRQLSAVMQRERAHGAYTTNAVARLRNASWPYTVIRELPNGTAVTVIDRGGREENFSLGGIFGEKKHHSWVRLADHTEGWIEDSLLTAVPAPAPAPAPVVPAPAPVVAAAPAVTRLVFAGGTGAHPGVRNFVGTLYDAGMAAGPVAAPAGGGVEAAASAAIRGAMGAGGGDYGQACRDRVANIVHLANLALYDITNANVQQAINSLTTQVVSAEYTTLTGDHADHMPPGMGHYEY